MDATPPPRRNPPPRNIALALGSSSRIKVKALGRPPRWLTDAYVRLMEMTWRNLLLIFVTGFISFNLFFATLYWLFPGGLVVKSRRMMSLSAPVIVASPDSRVSKRRDPSCG